MSSEIVHREDNSQKRFYFDASEVTDESVLGSNVYACL